MSNSSSYSTYFLDFPFLFSLFLSLFSSCHFVSILRLPMRIHTLFFSSRHMSEYLCNFTSLLYFSRCILSGFLCFYTLSPSAHSVHSYNISLLLPLHNLMNNDRSFRIYNKL